MFEVGFTEIILILGLALLVLGPEKLPALAEKIGRWTGRARAMARQLRTQLEHEVTLDELAKSKPMQASRNDPEPASTPATEPAPASGFDLDEHFAELDTKPDRSPSAASAGAHEGPPDGMRGKQDSEPAATMPGTPESDPFPERDTSPEAMHPPLKNTV